MLINHDDARFSQNTDQTYILKRFLLHKKIRMGASLVILNEKIILNSKANKYH